jgi:hypothetical protein
VFDRSDGSRIYTVNDEYGRLLHRYRRMPDGREIIIIDNRYSGPPNPFGYFVDLPPPVIRIPRERYIVERRICAARRHLLRAVGGAGRLH